MSKEALQPEVYLQTQKLRACTLEASSLLAVLESVLAAPVLVQERLQEQEQEE
jgi:hypothetical protein